MQDILGDDFGSFGAQDTQEKATTEDANGLFDPLSGGDDTAQQSETAAPDYSAFGDVAVRHAYLSIQLLTTT